MDGDSGFLGAADLEAVLAYAALGLIVGFGYYMSMHMNSGLPDGAPSWAVKGLHVLRLAAAIVFFGWLASNGALPVLSAFAGFLIGRVIAFRTLGEDA
ncbi:MAG TPA: hypothetical protein VES39_03010 [Rhodospirillales bacterium]|jgi:hypothetical protein|nr:hypothetical protein [Rhodospirillales bacterium]